MKRAIIPVKILPATLAAGVSRVDYLYEMPADEKSTPPAKSETPAPKPPSRVTIKWAGERKFDTGREGGAVARIDGDAKTGQSPPEALLSALASCASVDVVDILAKRRTPVTSLEVNVVGERVDAIPRRFKHITLAFKISGEGIEKAQAERAISLSVTKYCSVRDSLREDIAVDWTLELS